MGRYRLYFTYRTQCPKVPSYGTLSVGTAFHGVATASCLMACNMVGLSCPCHLALPQLASLWKDHELEILCFWSSDSCSTLFNIPDGFASRHDVIWTRARCVLWRSSDLETQVQRREKDHKECALACSKRPWPISSRAVVQDGSGVAILDLSPCSRGPGCTPRRALSPSQPMDEAHQESAKPVPICGCPMPMYTTSPYLDTNLTTCI